MWYLVGDVGGTNMRLAAVDADGMITARQSHSTTGGDSLRQVCAAFCETRASAPVGVAIAAAGVVTNGRVTLTNAAQGVCKADLTAACACADVHIINDFEAAAWSLATLDETDVRFLQGGPHLQPGPRVIIGPGTGLGVGAMVWRQGTPQAVPGEGGHMRLTPHSAAECAYFEELITLWPEVQMGKALAVEAEAILSGTGLPLWYRAIARAHGVDAMLTEAAAIFAAARAGDDRHARTAIGLFSQYLAGFVGDIAMLVGARGGVFLTGGVALSNPWIFDTAFLASFNAGGRHSAWRAQMPLGLYQNCDFGLLGARNFLMARTG
tara:strand:+ start:36157 stop:37125 length:969 start_codon:yes stop_codon:yes gene_type:complete